MQLYALRYPPSDWRHGEGLCLVQAPSPIQHLAQCELPPLLSSLLVDDIRFTLSTDSLSTQMSLNIGTELSNMNFQADVSNESLRYEPIFLRLSKARVELRTGDISTCRKNLIYLFKAAGGGHYLKPTTCLLGWLPTRSPSMIVPAPTHGYSSLTNLGQGSQ